jgi:hypothetical protein
VRTKLKTFAQCLHKKSSAQNEPVGHPSILNQPPSVKEHLNTRAYSIITTITATKQTRKNRNTKCNINSILAVIYLTKLQNLINRPVMNINSILAVIYLTKLQNLINRPVMNCSMSIFPYFMSLSFQDLPLLVIIIQHMILLIRYAHIIIINGCIKFIKKVYYYWLLFT